MEIESLYRCPGCGGLLEKWRDRYECKTCRAVYPIVVGIPDFRVYPDPYISLEEDRAKGCHLESAAARLSFADLVAHYYEITPEVPPDLAGKYSAHHVAGVTRGQAILERLRAYDLLAQDSSKTTGLDLDLGCGTLGFVAASLSEGLEAIGVDIAFRWLVVGRQRLREMGLDDRRLVCACADCLPFPDDRFDLVVAENLIEHTEVPAAALAEVNRVLHPSGAFMARTVNRFALAPEPHVGVWGVGYLPRRWMDRYVRLVKGIPYQHIYLRSCPDLRRMVRSSGLAGVELVYPYMAEQDYAHHTHTRKTLFQLYIRLGKLFPFLRPVLTLFGPFLDLVTQPVDKQARHRRLM
jgi:SAM-dependent methyltransferase